MVRPPAPHYAPCLTQLYGMLGRNEPLVMFSIRLIRKEEKNPQGLPKKAS